MNSEIITNLGEVKPVVIIGGKTGKFVPNLNMSFHGDEFFINLNRKDKIITDEIAEIVDFKTVLNGKDNDIFHVNENGEFKWDIEFKEKPKSNVFKWELKHTKGIEFYYQGELTSEEVEKGCVRAEDAIGSYAIYCNRVNNKYKTGKLCHIYRPFCYDANGGSIYADLKIEVGYLVITIPQDYIDNAVYPVTIDPTIGYNTIGASYWTRGSELAFYNLINTQAQSSGITANAYIYLTSGFNRPVQIGYYNGGSLIDSGTISSGWLTGWNSVDISGNIINNGSNYNVALCVGDYGTGDGGIAYDDYDDAVYYSVVNSLPSTWSSTSYYPRIQSMYIEYTESTTGNTYYYQQMQM